MFRLFGFFVVAGFVFVHAGAVAEPIVLNPFPVERATSVSGHMPEILDDEQGISLDGDDEGEAQSDPWVFEPAEDGWMTRQKPNRPPQEQAVDPRVDVGEDVVDGSIVDGVIDEMVKASQVRADSEPLEPLLVEEAVKENVKKEPYYIISADSGVDLPNAKRLPMPKIEDSQDQDLKVQDSKVYDSPAQVAVSAPRALASPVDAHERAVRDSALVPMPQELRSRASEPLFVSAARDTAPEAKVGRVNVPRAEKKPKPKPSVVPAPETYQWDARKGQSLKQILSGWAEAGDVEMLWHYDRALLVLDDVQRNGAFEDAVLALLEQYKGRNLRPVGTLYVDNAAGKKTLRVAEP